MEGGGSAAAYTRRGGGTRNEHQRLENINVEQPRGYQKISQSSVERAQRVQIRGVMGKSGGGGSEFKGGDGKRIGKKQKSWKKVYSLVSKKKERT